MNGIRKRYQIAFDCDGTLVTTESASSGRIVPNERIRSLLIAFASLKFVTIKGVKYKVEIIVWSGGGEIWAHQVVRELGLTKYVDTIMAKNVIGHDADGHPIIEADITPDMAFDDIHSCELGIANFIVCEK